MKKIINICSGATYVDHIGSQTVNNYNAPVNNYNAPVNNYSASACGNNMYTHGHDMPAVVAVDDAHRDADCTVPDTIGTAQENIYEEDSDALLDPAAGGSTQGQLTPEDRCVKAALERMLCEGVLCYAYDYVWVFELFRKADVHRLPYPFYSVASFVRYLKDRLCIEGCPCASSLTRKASVVWGTFPVWEFSDKPDGLEKQRRINVGKCFLSFFRKG